MAAGSRTGQYQICLEARSPLITAVLDPTFARLDNNTGNNTKANEQQAVEVSIDDDDNAEEDNVRPKSTLSSHFASNNTQKPGTGKQQPFSQTAESEQLKIHFQTALEFYQKSLIGVQKSAKDIDPVDEIQLNLAGFKWN